jgi:hypothetical protein
MTLECGILGLGAGEGMELALMPIVENWVGIWRVMVKFAFKVGGVFFSFFKIVFRDCDGLQFMC